jgi:hypothetical protein
VAAGLIAYAQRVAVEQPRAARATAESPNGLMGRLGRLGIWLRENF